MSETDIYASLQHRLITNDFEHGEKLRAEQLKQDYGCSASTVREALFRLSTEGLVDFQEQRGFRVPLKSPILLAELTHLRILLEAEGTVLSIRHGGVAWEAKLTAAHHQLSHIEKRIHAASDSAPFMGLWFNAELEFHQTLISACNSDSLKAMHIQIYRKFRQQHMDADRNFEFISMNIQHHHAILVAALDGNENLTRQKIHDHLARHLEPAKRVQSAELAKSSSI
ncbi:MAG: GntR family transcriptional regulator [Roseobacter sp.]